MADPVSQTTGGNALLDAGIAPYSPWEFIMNHLSAARITPGIAEDLAGQTGMSAQSFLNMQQAYDERLIAEASGWKPTL